MILDLTEKRQLIAYILNTFIVMENFDHFVQNEAAEKHSYNRNKHYIHNIRKL